MSVDKIRHSEPTLDGVMPDADGVPYEVVGGDVIGPVQPRTTEATAAGIIATKSTAAVIRPPWPIPAEDTSRANSGIGYPTDYGI